MFFTIPYYRYKIVDLCLCPASGALHFYGSMRDALSLLDHVSMPYIGRTSFLQLIVGFVVLFFIVSMPYIGRTSFLLGGRNRPMECR